MNVILLDNVENLGNIGDLVTVKPGFGRNFLIPQGKAALATPQNIKEIEARREVRMPDGPIHELGEYEVGVHLHSSVNATVKVRVVAAE